MRVLKGKEAAGSMGIMWNRHAGKKISKHVKIMLLVIPWSLLVAPKGGIKGYKSVVEVMVFCCAPCWGATSKSHVEGYSDDLSQGMAGWLWQSGRRKIQLMIH